MFLEVDEWTIEWDKEENLWLVYPTEEGNRSWCNFNYFSSEREAIEFAHTYSSETVGGNMEDKCVWKYEEKNQFYYKAISPHKNLDCLIDNSSKWKYCPYCGKEIQYDKQK